MSTIPTPFGPIRVLPALEFHPTGEIRSCFAAEACSLQTPYGSVTPQYQSNTLRKRQLPAIGLYPNGMIRALPLEEQAEIHTTVGVVPAEQLTFYENGELKRVFPLNGKLSGFWSQEDEEQLAEPLEIDTPIGRLKLKIVSLYFSPAGALRSLTLWPGEVLDAHCSCGDIPARSGIAFYDTGEIKSLEPSGHARAATPLGELRAYDPDSVGICGDVNSLRFGRDGKVLCLSTISDAFDVALDNGEVKRVSPPMRRNACDGETLEPGPLRLAFAGDRVTFSAEGVEETAAFLDRVSRAPARSLLPKMSECRGLKTMW